MGTTASTPLQMEEKRQRELMERLGVLIPPSFGVADITEGLVIPPSAISMLRPSPSYLYSLETHSACYRLLHEHMTSGLWVAASTPSQASVLAAFYVKGNENEGMLSASQNFGNGTASIRAYTSEASLVSGDYSLTPFINVVGNVDAAKGMAWIGCHVNPTEWWRMRAAKQQKQQSQQYYRNNPFADEQTTTETNTAIQNFQIGTSVIKLLQQAFTTKTTFTSPSVQVDSILGYASTEIAGCTVAMETTVPLETLDPQVSYYFSANLNTSQGPPLIVCMQNSSTRSVMNLSQILTLDRIVVNVLETKCPRIRNTFGWAVQMEKKSGGEATSLAAGLAWQINRSVGVKVVAKNNSGVTGALLLKRWKQPRVLCTLLAGTVVPGKDIQLGIGLELETGPSRFQDYYNDKKERRVVDDDVPVTKAILPDIEVTRSL